MRDCFLFLVALLTLTVSSSQEIELPEDVLKDFIFIQDLNGKPALVTQKAIYRLENKWIKTSFKNILTKKDSTAIYSSYRFNNKTYTPINFNNQIHLILNGGGYVLSLSNNELKRIDNSVDQKNQFGGAVFIHNNQLYNYGGYGFWKFKDYMTYYDKPTGQWEYLVTKSKKSPLGRWKMLFQTIDNKLFVLGGRTSLKESSAKDALLNSYFIYDFTTKTFEDKGEFNPKTPTKSFNNKGFILEGKKAYAKQKELVIIDFIKEEINQISSKELFKNLDNGYLVFESQDTLYYMSSCDGMTKLSKLAVSELLSFKTTTYPIAYKKEQTNIYWLILTVFLVALISWLLDGLFRYKDFLKELILFDESTLYFRDHSVQVTSNQHLAIQNLSIKGQLNSIELNEIICPKNKFAKSHLTLLRQKFIKELNSVFYELTKSESVSIKELKNPKDRRFLIYKTTQEVLKKPSFAAFLFKL